MVVPSSFGRHDVRALEVSLPMVDNNQSESALDQASFEEQSSRRSRRRLCLLLDGGSLALFSIFLVRLLSVMLGSNPYNTRWQAEFIDVLVNQAQIAFLGFVLLHLASFVQPHHDNLRRRLRLVRTLAVVPVIGFLLLIPLQITSSYGDFSAAQARRTTYLSQSVRLTELREAIRQAKNVQDLNVRLQSLLEPALTGDQLNNPLPQLRQNLLRQNQALQDEITERLKTNLENIDPVSVVMGRVGSALGWALAFAAGAVPWGSRSTLMERLRRR